MATKKSRAPAKKFKELRFNVEQIPGCCGIGVVSGFQEDQGQYDYFSGRYKSTKAKYATKEEQIDAMYEQMLKETWKQDWEAYSQLLISLVSSYATGAQKGKHQCQELQDKLLKEGWTIYSVFVNTNHGNEITLFGKYFPERDMVARAALDKDEEEYEEEF